MATLGFAPYNCDKATIVHVPEGATQTFKAGDLVYMTSGTVKIATSDQTVFGAAVCDASGTTSTSIPVYVADPSTVWTAQVDTTSAASQIGAKYGLNIGTAGSMSIDIADTTTTSVRVIDIHPHDGAKALGRVLFLWRTKALMNDGAA